MRERQAEGGGVLKKGCGPGREGEVEQEKGKKRSVESAWIRTRNGSSWEGGGKVLKVKGRMYLPRWGKGRRNCFQKRKSIFEGKKVTGFWASQKRWERGPVWLGDSLHPTLRGGRGESPGKKLKGVLGLIVDARDF